MATKNSDAFSSDNEDSYSTYSEDFENESRSPTPDHKRRYQQGNKRYGRHDVASSSERTSSSVAATKRSAKKSTQSDYHRRTNKPTISRKHGWRSSSFSKDAKRKLTTVKDPVQARMLSAQKNRINLLNNELSETQMKFEDLVKENKLLKTLQHRQDRALQRFEATESDLPRLISQHTEDQRVLKMRLRKSQDSERQLETKLRDTNEELQRMETTLRRLKKLVYDKNLGERSELAKQLHLAEDKLTDTERKNKDLEKKLELTTHSFARQINGERSKHRETKERLELLHDEYLTVQTRLKEKERALEVSNIYALRTKQNPEKSFVVGKQSPRQPIDRGQLPPTDPSPLPLATTSQTVAVTNKIEPSKPAAEQFKLTTNTNAVTRDVTDFRKTIKSPAKIFQTEREDSDLLDLGNPNKPNDISKGLNGLRLHEANRDKQAKEKEDSKPNRSVFLTANFESPLVTPNSTFISDGVPSSDNRLSPHDSLNQKSPVPRKDDFAAALEAKKAEAELDQQKRKFEEDRRKKAALLAKMKDLEDDDSTPLPLGGKKASTGDDMRKLLGNGTKSENKILTKQDRVHDNNPRESFESRLLKKLSEDKMYSSANDDLLASDSKGLSPRKPKKLYRFPREVENLHLGIPSTGDLTKTSSDKMEAELTFGGYAPTVAAPPKRKPRTQAKKNVNASTSGSESDEPMLDLVTGKAKKNDLLQQLFGEQATKPASNGPLKKENSFNTSRESSNLSKTNPRAKPVHSGYPWEHNVVPASQGNGDGNASRDRKNDILGAPLVKAVPSFNDDDIEEVIL